MKKETTTQRKSGKERKEEWKREEGRVEERVRKGGRESEKEEATERTEGTNVEVMKGRWKRENE